MYGYVIPQKSTLSNQDFVLYRSFYCGICCQTGKLFGQLPRFTTNYDFTFLSALLHDAAKADIVIEEHGCVLNPKKKAILQPNPLHERIAAANIILSYKKAEDGVKDGDGLKYGLARRAFSRPYKKAAAAFPEIAEAVNAAYEKIDSVETENVESLDRAADPFASMMAKISEVIIGERIDDNLKGLCYNIGKFVYFADAIDDLEDDFRKKRYNPFIAALGEFKSRADFMEKNKDAVEFAVMSTYARAVDCFIRLNLTQSRSLLTNIVCEGLKAKAEELLGAKKKLRPPKI
ncbi:MAG: hypothetical protein J1F39_05685 [Clostridiales bacterium]|nr:hypothetical protein [Clostridiales bacterium]